MKIRPYSYKTMMRIKAFPLGFNQELLNLTSYTGLGVSVYFGRRILNTQLRLEELKSLSQGSEKWYSRYISLVQLKKEMLEKEISPELAISAFRAVQGWFGATGNKPEHFQILNLRDLKGKEKEFMGWNLDYQIQQLVKSKVIVFEPSDQSAA